MPDLKVLVVDDEAPARARLKRMVAALPGCLVVGEAASGQQALAAIDEHQPDVLLLDISMPGLDGMGLARVLREQAQPPAVVFCTAWPDQALDAFNTGAIDYLVKPVRAERLQVALERAARFVRPAGPRGQGSFLSSTVAGRAQLIELQSVLCLHAEDKLTTVYHEQGEAVIDESLVDIEREHGELFLRVHRNALVARERVRGLQSGKAGTMRVIIDGCSFQPRVSRRQLSAVRRLIKELQ
jgi:two-component system response regulator AlgR